MPRTAMEPLVAALLEHAPVTDGVTPREVALLAYADVLTRTPAAVAPGDVASLRAVGLDDRGIHDAGCIVAYFAFVNRVADGLGVEIETAP